MHSIVSTLIFNIIWIRDMATMFSMLVICDEYSLREHITKFNFSLVVKKVEIHRIYNCKMKTCNTDEKQHRHYIILQFHK